MDLTPLYVLAVVAGAVLGSFGNVLIYRVPESKTITGRSHCPHCRRTLVWFELVPVLSFVFLLGRCRTCKKPISWQYPLVEGASALLAVSALAFAPDPLCALPLGIALWLLLLLAIIDARTGTVPDALSIPFILSAVAWGLLRQPFTAAASVDLAYAVLIGAGFFLAQWALSRGRWVGSGDIFLAAGIGALVGTPALTVLALALSYIIGSLVAVVLLLFRRTTLASDLAFGPFLAIAGIAALFHGELLLKLLKVN